MGKESELLHAVKNGDVSSIRKLLLKFKSGPKGKKSVSKKIHVNAPDDDGFTALHHAALVNNVEVVLALLDMEADPNSRDKKGMCPLHMASWAGKDQVVKALLDNRALVNLPSFSGETPLLLASQHGYANVVEVLMKYNADPTVRNNCLESPLDLACQFGHAAVVRLLLMRGEVIHMLRDRHLDVRYKKPLHLAAKGGHIDVTRLLIESGADVNEESPQGTSLHLAALYGKVDVVKALLEAGADVHAINKKNLTPLDMVNQFTTSRAAIEIKQLLREAAGETVVYARAISDNINVYDPTSLRFKSGETITILEQNENGRWKGSVIDGQEERVGFFPAKSVKIISSRRNTQSLGSMSSSSESSISSSSGKDVNSQPPTSPSRRMTDSRQPVGVVPIGSFEVLTLATGQTPEQKKPSNIPRLNSFRKGAIPARARKAISYEETQQEESSNSIDISMDSGVDSQVGTDHDHSYDRLPSLSIKPIEENVYDPVPSNVHGPVPSNVYDPVPSNVHGPVPSNVYDPVPSNIYDPVPSDIHGPVPSDIHGPVPSDIHGPVPSNIHGPIPSNIYDPVPSNAYDSLQPVNAKSPRNIDTELHNNQTNEHHQQHETSPTLNNYADIFVKPNINKPPISPNNNSMPTRYSEVYVTGRSKGEQDHGTVSHTVPIPGKRPQQKDFQESYERMNFAEDSLRYGRTPEEISHLKTDSRTRGYEDMRANSPSDEPFPSPPLLPLKNQSFSNDDDNNVPLPPKKIESRAIQRRQDSYENVKPKQLVPVHSQNPFDKNSKTGAAEVTSKSDQAAGYGDYQNYRAPNVDVPIRRSNTSTYENYRPTDVNDDRIVRAATVAERPHRAPITRPVPLPPKMNRRNSQEPITPNPMSPAEASSNSPFFCQMNLDELQEDERELLSWLIDLKLPQYFHNFQIEGYDMISVRGIAPEDLMAVNITKAGHKKKLLSEIAKLKPTTKLPNYKPDDVGVWLELLGLRVYEENFIEGGFDDMDFIKDLDLSDLEMIEIKKKGHQKKLLLAVQKLSDIELTADLDKVVGASSMQQPIAPTQQQPQQQGHLLKQLNEQPVISAQNDYLKYQSHENNKFPPPPPTDSFDKAFLSNRDNLPPPSGTESVSSSYDPLHPIPPKAPAHFVQSNVKPQSNTEQPIPRDRSVTSPNVPRPKPKPKPGQNRGQVRTASEYHSNDSPSRSVILPTPVVPHKPSAQINGDDTDNITAAKARELWQHNQQQQEPTAATTSTNLTRQKSLPPGVKPITSPRPLPKPKPKPTIPERGNNEPHPHNQPDNKPVPPRSPVKKVPPPAPPRRDSMTRKDKVTEMPNEAEICATDRKRTMSGPLDEKIRNVFRTNKHAPSKIVPAPVMEEKVEDVEEASTEQNIVEELEATDSIMADIDSMIADFNNELDSMF